LKNDFDDTFDQVTGLRENPKGMQNNFFGISVPLSGQDSSHPRCFFVGSEIATPFFFDQSGREGGAVGSALTFRNETRK